jgi:HTH-type transcriptional regulator, competence development regulator
MEAIVPPGRRAGPVGDTRPFGQRVRQLREARRIKLRDFAEQVGLSATYLSQAERGEAWPPAEEKVLAIARALDQDPDELLALAGRVASDLTAVIRAHPRSVARLLRAIDRLPPEGIERLAWAVDEAARVIKEEPEEPVGFILNRGSGGTVLSEVHLNGTEVADVA